MQSAQMMAEKNKILEIVNGSFLYGTNIATSDKDFIGAFIADKKYYLGLEKVEEVDLSIVSKTSDGKNDTDAIDRKFTEFRKLIRLIADGNPNIQELIFVDEVRNKNQIIYINDIGKKLLANRDMFISKLAKQRYIGYSISQMHKARVKPDNHLDLTKFKEMYEDLIKTNEGKATKLIEFKFNGHSLSSLIKFHQDFATIGGLNFNLNVKIAEVYSSVCVRLDKASNRASGWLEKGYDTKFMMHNIRLLYEGKELLETGKIEFPLKQRDVLLSIRNGAYNLNEINEMSETLLRNLEGYESDLPASPDFNKVNKFLIDTVEEFWCNNTDRSPWKCRVCGEISYFGCVHQVMDREG